MVAALVRWQFALAVGDPFTDAPDERVIGGAGLREGRNVAQLGGPIIPVAVFGPANWCSSNL